MEGGGTTAGEGRGREKVWRGTRDGGWRGGSGGGVGGSRNSDRSSDCGRGKGRRDREQVQLGAESARASSALIWVGDGVQKLLSLTRTRASCLASPHKHAVLLHTNVPIFPHTNVPVLSHTACVGVMYPP